MYQKLIIATSFMFLIFILYFIPAVAAVTKADNGCQQLPMPFISSIRCLPESVPSCVYPGGAMTISISKCPS